MHYGDIRAPWSSFKPITAVGDSSSFTAYALASSGNGRNLFLLYHTTEKGMNYIIGKSNSKGKVNSWGKPIPVPNPMTFNDGKGFDLERLGLSVVDVDGNGKEDLVITYSLYRTYETTSEVFVRVGRDLHPASGRVTKGWTDMRQVDDFKAVSFFRRSCDRNRKLLTAGAYMSDERELSDEELILIKHEGTFSHHVNISSDRQIITKDLLDTVNSPPIPSAYSGCGECYKPWRQRQCERRTNACYVSVEEVHVASPWKNGVVGSASTSRMDLQPKNSLEIGTETFLNFTSARIWRKAGRQSLFCLGFEYVYSGKDKDVDFCDIVDRERIVSKGAELAMLRDIGLSGSKDVLDVYIRTLFADPAGVNGAKNQQIVAQVVIRGKKWKLGKVVNRVVGQLRKRQELGASGGMRVVKFYHKGRWFIRLLFTPVHTKEL